MTREEFFENFELFAELPGAVAKMRQLILHFAIVGELVTRDPEESAASSLPRLAAVAVEGTASDAYPGHWLRVPLGATGAWFGGGTPSKARAEFWTGTIPWVSPKDMKMLRIDDAEDHISEAAIEASPVRMIPSGSLLMVVRGMILAKAFPVALTTRAVTINQDMKALLPNERETAPFLLLALRALESQILSAVERSSHGTCKLRRDALEAMVLPIPPLAEQKRIVAKVDELMALCDRLEAQQKERDTRRAALARASLAHFAEAPTPARVRLLFHNSYSITPPRLRDAILALAVEGRLVEQNASDESADEWLARSVPQSKTVSKSPYPVPPGWTWRYVDDLFAVAGGIQKTPDRTPRKNAFPYVGVANVYRGRLDLTTVKKFELEPGEIGKRRLQPGDLLVIEGNGSFTEIGRCAKWDGEIANCVHQNHVIRCRPFDVRISDFVLLFLNSPHGSQIMQRLAITSSGLYSLSVGKIRRITIPLPPLAEQRRILSKVGQLMASVELLASQVASARLVGAKLAEALVPELTAGLPLRLA